VTKRLLLASCFLFFLVGCAGPAHPAMEPTPTSTVVDLSTATSIPTASILPSQLTQQETATMTPMLAPVAWENLPIVPTVSPQMVAVYQRGLAAGRDPNRFSKVGDCQNITSYFLSSFDTPGDYELGGKYAYLQPTIDHFAGSWSRNSLAVKGGMNVAAVLNSMWADPKQCKVDETPLACEIQVYNPSFVTISMETWWSEQPASVYESYLRQVVVYVLSQNVVPILATKADDLEGNNSINAAIANVAYEYQVPLWNFWAATYPLPDHGLSADHFHLTFARNFFDDPVRMESGWPWRNLTALEAIDAVWKGVSGAQ
jgi:hypothetical protein